MSLAETLVEESPIDRVTAECGECEMEFFDSMKTQAKPYFAADLISMKAEQHRSRVGHDDLQVDIQKPTPPKTIDATVTVNG